MYNAQNPNKYIWLDYFRGLGMESQLHGKCQQIPFVYYAYALFELGFCR